MSPQTQTETLTYRCPHCQTPVEVSPLAASEPLKCPNEACGKAFKVELPAAKPMAAPVATPVNGDARAAPAAVPASVAEPVRAVDKEEAVARVKLSMWRRYPVRCLIYTAAIVAGLAGVIVGLVNDWLILALLCGAVVLLASIRFFPWWAQMCATTLTITNLRFILETGVLKREATELRRDQIGDLQVQQSLLMRLLDVGDLAITSNTGDRKRVVVMAVPQPEWVAEHLRATKVVTTEAHAPASEVTG
jgi:uncharacterized membrane protein YdbT with pleckstrin-like domain